VEVPRSFLSTLKAGYFSSAQTGLESGLLAREQTFDPPASRWVVFSGVT